jgi:hypothetical protein
MRYEDLITSVPRRASPAEHQATLDSRSRYQLTRCIDDDDETKWQIVKEGMDWDNPGLHAKSYRLDPA